MVLDCTSIPRPGGRAQHLGCPPQALSEDFVKTILTMQQMLLKLNPFYHGVSAATQMYVLLLTAFTPCSSTANTAVQPHPSADRARQ